jgi:hypothetical protein
MKVAPSQAVQARKVIVILTLATNLGVGGYRHALITLVTGKRPASVCTGGWVGPRASQGGCREEKNLLLSRGFEPEPSIPSTVIAHSDRILASLTAIFRL